MGRENQQRYNISSSSSSSSSRRRGGGGGKRGDHDEMMMMNGGGTDGGGGGSGSVIVNTNNTNKLPAWLEGLMGETFFGGCGAHENRRKNEKNVFCLLCCLSICPHCLPSHSQHPLLQVRRYVYHDVIRLGDLEKLIDCSYIQPYTINHAKVIFLNQRPQSRSCKGASNSCLTCDRILQDSFHFCSLSCKVDYMVYQGQDLSSILYRINPSDFAFSQFEGLRVDDDGQITPNSILEDPLQYKNSSCSSENMGNSGISHEPMIVKKKKKGFLPGIVLSLSSRRKGAPQRAPLS